MASSRTWFESVAEAQRRARRRLPPSVYAAVIAGAEQGVTLEDNVRAFGELGFIPRIATGCGRRDLTTTVLGEELALPVAISPPASRPCTRRASWRSLVRRRRRARP